MSTVFFTWFPGFLGARLLPRVLLRSPQKRAVCLVQDRFLSLAKRRVEQIISDHPELDGRIELLVGDITVEGLGLVSPSSVAKDVVEVWHLAAAYDLEVPRDVGMRINVDGTRNVLAFAQRADTMAYFHYVSTCYVSGRYAGPFGEGDLERGQRFNNFYEETKFLAEVLVQQRMAEGLATTIYRPAIVVGDSVTGETQKYDGPYFVLQWLMRQPRLAVMPVIGDPASFRLNMVPSDFIIDAVTHLSGLPQAVGRVYQLADPDALTIEDLLGAMADATHRKVFHVPMPRKFAKWSIRNIPGVFPLMRIPAATVDYMSHPTYYLTANASEDLAGSGISCPTVRSYLPTLVDYMRRHPEVSPSAMI